VRYELLLEVADEQSRELKQLDVQRLVIRLEHLCLGAFISVEECKLLG